jgi:hypothetical protein
VRDAQDGGDGARAVFHASAAATHGTRASFDVREFVAGRGGAFDAHASARAESRLAREVSAWEAEATIMLGECVPAPPPDVAIAASTSDST